jgi:hypothetical protein
MTDPYCLKNFLLNRDEYRYGAGSRLEKSPATVRSEVYAGDLSIARSCVLRVPDKFLAQTLVIFPKQGINTPIFGIEYIEMPGKCFGAVDFHPQARDVSLVQRYLADCPDREVEKSKHYDLNEYFSPKLWLRKSATPLYGEFMGVSQDRIQRYHCMLKSVEPGPALPPSGYSEYMAEHDPARGILRAYFGQNFADDYIKYFLFPNDPDYNCMLGDLSRLSS